MITSLIENYDIYGNFNYDNFSHRKARVAKLWSHDHYNII